MLCPRCGSSNSPDVSVCASCGSALTVLPTTCPTCSEPITASDRFCRNCGAPNTLWSRGNIQWDETRGEQTWGSDSQAGQSSHKLPRKHRRLWAIAGLGVLAALIGGAALAATRWSEAQSNLRAAAGATRSGAYTTAAQDLSQAHSAWPWLNVDSELHTVHSLAQSQSDFRSGLADWHQGDFTAATGYFAKVASGARAYPLARRYLKIYRVAKADGVMVGTMEKDLAAVISTVDTFTSEYDSGTTPLNAAFQNYAAGYAGLVSDPTTFQQDITQASSAVSQLTVDATAVQAAAAGFANAGGVMEQTGTLSNGQLTSLLSTISDETSQVNAMEQAMGNAVTDTQDLGNGGGSTATVNNDISAGNAALARLQSDEQAAIQEAAAVYGYDKTAINAFVGVATAAAAFIPSSSSSSNGVS